MILLLRIIDREQACWQTEECQRLFSLRDAGVIIQNYEKFCQEQAIDCHQIEAFGFQVLASSMTQVKTAVAIMNLLAWHWHKPIFGSFYQTSSADDFLAQIRSRMGEENHFVPLQVVYDREPDISASKKTLSFKIQK